MMRKERNRKDVPLPQETWRGIWEKDEKQGEKIREY